MLPVETELHLRMNVMGAGVEINDLAIWAAEVKHELSCQVVTAVLMAVQEQHLERVFTGEAELVCTGCGVVHTGSGSVLRRGSRRRKLRTSSGEIIFELRQVTCSTCRKTWSPYLELLGVAPRQRVLEELERRLVDWVTELSYGQTVRLGAAWLGATLSKRRLHSAVQRYGARVRFTAAEPTAVLVADGTMVASGEKRWGGDDISVVFQVIGRTREGRRPRAIKRVVGFGSGAGHWQETLATTSQPKLVVTDRERGLHRLVSERFPRARHQQCEWHLAHGLSYALWRDGVAVKPRRQLSSQLTTILKLEPAPAAAAYQRLLGRLGACPKARAFLENSAPYVLYPTPSQERTTALAEREMRELNRRTDVGVRWSLSGVSNLLRLRLAQRHNPDDYERIWTSTQRVECNLVPQTRCQRNSSLPI